MAECHDPSTTQTPMMPGPLSAAERQPVEQLEPLSQIIRELNLRKPIFQRTAAYGHFGRVPDDDGGFSWEKTDRVDDLKACL